MERDARVWVARLRGLPGGRLGRLAAWLGERPVAGLWALAALVSLPGLWRLLPDFSEDPDMGRVAPFFLEYPASRLGALFTAPSPWGDGSYRPIISLAWWIDGRVWGDWAPGWGLTNWLMAVACAALLGHALLRLSGQPVAAYGATVFAALSHWASVVARHELVGLSCTSLVVCVAAWAVWSWWRAEDARLLGLVTRAGLLAWVIGSIEWWGHSWVSLYVGGRTVLWGTLLHLVGVLLVLRYAETGRARYAVLFAGTWAAMMLSYEQPLCLPVAMAPAFLAAVPRERWRRALPLLACAALLTMPYLALRWHFVQTHGVSDYQVQQFRRGWMWLADLGLYVFPPAWLGLTMARRPALLDLILPTSVLWRRLLTAMAWLIVYVPALRRDRGVRLWYWWRVVAYLPLVRFHPHTHYWYLPQLARAAAHGLLVDRWLHDAKGLASAEKGDESPVA